VAEKVKPRKINYKARGKSKKTHVSRVKPAAIKNASGADHEGKKDLKSIETQVKTKKG